MHGAALLGISNNLPTAALQQELSVGIGYLRPERLSVSSQLREYDVRGDRTMTPRSNEPRVHNARRWRAEPTYQASQSGPTT